ncbi:zinc-binding alcohol dehydrogenase family protein [Microbacterium sp. P07]|uniref:zinc-binding alcohol dehydrogenase family protein n=1 Tax=Microbacterium sp. P07 TaxID=3366952 RepID=UPI003746B6D8
MTSNTAAWIDAPYADLTVREAPLPVATPTQLVVRVRAVAVNPLDAITQSNGRLMYRWLAYPVVLGEDVAGEVVSVGGSVTRFVPGDRVFAYAVGMERGRDQVAEGGFQTFVAVEEGLAAPIPAGMDFADAAVLPLAVSTAASALFQVDQLGLSHPSAAAIERDETVVIWGGSTSVGANAIQLARAAGYAVITTASPRNHERLRALGAAHVFDYRDPDVVEKIAAAARGSKVKGVLAIATGSAEPSVAIAIATGAKRVALSSPSVSFYDQPRRGGFSATRARLMARLITGNVLLQIRCALHGVRARFVWGSSLMKNEVGRMLWTDHLPSALADGRHAPFPAPRIVGTSLADVQPALDALREGTSTVKLVIALD